jgi:hypothetical protein
MGILSKSHYVFVLLYLPLVAQIVMHYDLTAMIWCMSKWMNNFKMVLTCVCVCV